VVCAIPRGRVSSYGAVARAAGLPGRARGRVCVTGGAKALNLRGIALVGCRRPHRVSEGIAGTQQQADVCSRRPCRVENGRVHARRFSTSWVTAGGAADTQRRRDAAKGPCPSPEGVRQRLGQRSSNRELLVLSAHVELIPYLGCASRGERAHRVRNLTIACRL